MDYEGLLEQVKNRRSIRKFKSDPVPDEYVYKIIEMARYAPSGFNTQPWDFVVVKKEELRKRIIEILVNAREKAAATKPSIPSEPTSARPLDKLMNFKGQNYEAFLNAPIFILLYGDTRARVGLPPGLDRGPDEKYMHILEASLANAFLYMHLAASSLGLAAKWWTQVAFEPSHTEVKELLGIPQALIAYDMLLLGYPDAVPRPKLMRPIEKMIHFDDCGASDFRTTEEVHNFAMKTKAWTIGQHHREEWR